MGTHGTRVLAERYALEELLGRGGMADVFRATDTVLERDVAVKLLRTYAVSERDRARFHDEARLLAALDHDGVVAILDAGLSDDDSPYLVMDLVDGTSLARVRNGKPLPGHRMAHVGASLASVLGYVHARGVVHRDIKPSNILIGRDGVVRLADFGIARMLGDVTGHTATGTTIGTAGYIAPEQVRGEPVTAASDVYSLGLVLLEALTGQRAYTGGPMEAALARLHTAPLIPTSLPTGWHGLLARMTDVEPAERPTATEVEAALRALQAPAPTAEPLRRERRATDHVAGAGAGVVEDAEEEAPTDGPSAATRRTAWVVSSLAALMLTLGAVGMSLAGLGH